MKDFKKLERSLNRYLFYRDHVERFEDRCYCEEDLRCLTSDIEFYLDPYGPEDIRLRKSARNLKRFLSNLGGEDEEKIIKQLAR